MPRATLALVLPCLVALAAPTQAVISGGGSPLTDCYVVLDGVTETRPRRVDCVDGSDCDADGSRDAVCSFDVRVCVNAYRPRDPECAPRRRVESITVQGALLALPPLPSLFSRCGEATRIALPVRRRPDGRTTTSKLKLRMTATRLGKPRKDKDSVIFYCRPDPCPDTDGPSTLALILGPYGSDADLGWSGAGHNLPVAGGTFPFCLSGCAGEGQDCVGHVNPSYASDALGLAPVPVRVAGTPVCLQPRLTLPSEIRASAKTGSVDGVGRLEAAAYVTTPTAICPRCVDPFNGGVIGGTTCDGGPRQGHSCAVAGIFWVPDADGNPLYPVSRDCPPATDLLVADVAAELSVTTGTSMLAGPCPGADGTPLPADLCDEAGCGGACACAADDPTLCRAMAGGVQQTCCVSDASHPCFPTGAPVIRVGVPRPVARASAGHPRCDPFGLRDTRRYGVSRRRACGRAATDRPRRPRRRRPAALRPVAPMSFAAIHAIDARGPSLPWRRPASSPAMPDRLDLLPAGRNRLRCGWARNELAVAYHDAEWGVPLRDDRGLFEFLVLEGMQAGLSWDCILRKRPAFRAAFAHFDPERVARFGPRDVRRLLADAGIVRNRLKVEAAIANARAFLAVQEEAGSFARYAWRFVSGRPIVNRWTRIRQVPATNDVSDAWSKDLRARGFRFVGSTIIYAHMQATGMVNDHLLGCFRYRQVGRRAASAA